MTEKRLRARDLGFTPGILPTGRLNAITDVAGVKVGHFTLIEGEHIRTGVTTILPHGGNLYQDKVPAGLAVGNGFGKLMGSTQLVELGEIETPIQLTNTMAVPRAAEALIDWTLSQPGNENVRSVNPIVGETNDGMLNDIRARTLTVEHMRQALENASEGLVAEGCVGAGTGTVCFGWKGGIGSSSRVLMEAQGDYTLGALVQSNFGGVLQMDGIPVGKLLGSESVSHSPSEDGSIMIVIATDAPLSDRNLTRLTRRGLAGLARTGASMSNGSGDYAIAFSTHEGVRRTPERRKQARPACAGAAGTGELGRRAWAYPEASNEMMSPLFQAAIECTEEAIYNSLTMATTMQGNGVTVEALPLEKVKSLMRTYKA
jgi:D-aminopeptidase